MTTSSKSRAASNATATTVAIKAKPEPAQAKFKSKVVPEAAAQATAAPGADNGASEGIGEEYVSMFSKFMGFELPSTKRVIVAFAANLLLAGGVTYLGLQLTSFLIVGAMALTGSAFLMFMVGFIGYAVSLIVGIMAGSKLQAVILDGSLERGFSAVRSNVINRVSGWFNKTEIVAS